MADTLSPTVAPATVLVPANGDYATVAAQIRPPTDDTTPSDALAVTVAGLPTFGTIEMADESALTAGQRLTTAQLSSLKWTGFPFHAATPYQSTGLFTYDVTDQAGNTGIGAATVVEPGDDTPGIAGTHASTAYGAFPTQPFVGVTVQDAAASAAGTAGTIRIQVLGDGTLSGAGLTRNSDGSYALGAAAPDTLSTELDQLSYTPAPDDVGNTRTLVVTAVFGQFATTIDLATTVADRPIGDAPPAAVSLDPGVSYAEGAFTLTGHAESLFGLGPVEITAQVDGVATDLGTATVDADGKFSFSDLIGAQTQGFITATAIDGAGRTASSTAAYSLMGGLPGGAGEQDTYSVDGSAALATTRFTARGQRFVSIEAPGQTVDIQPYDVVSNHGSGDTRFVYTPGAASGAVDVIKGFKLGGADHDTLALPSSDFKSIADVLRHTGDVGGSAFITDPQTGSAVRLAGVATAELKAHRNDIVLQG